MPDWTTITDSQVDPDAPITSGLGFAWRDNPIAIAEGATGAPRIVGAGLMRLADYPVLTVTAGSADAGTLVDTVVGSTTESAGSFTALATYTVQRATGTLRFNMTHRNNLGGGSNASDLRILKNGVTVNSWTTLSATDVSRVQDIAVVPGDVILVEHRRVNGGTSFATSNVTASDGYVIRPAYVKISEVNTP